MINIELISPLDEAKNVVKTVNEKTGDVVLTAADVKALPEDTYIPSIEGLASEKYVDDAIRVIELTPGPQGKPGKDGADGKDYVLTEADKAEIAGMVEGPGADVDLTDYYTKDEIDALLANLPSGGEVLTASEEVEF